MTGVDLAVEDAADPYRVLLRLEGADDAAEGLEGRPGQDRCRGVDELAEGLEVVGVEDFHVVEVLKAERNFALALAIPS